MQSVILKMNQLEEKEERNKRFIGGGYKRKRFIRYFEEERIASSGIEAFVPHVEPLPIVVVRDGALS